MATKCSSRTKALPALLARYIRAALRNDGQHEVASPQHFRTLAAHEGAFIHDPETIDDQVVNKITITVDDPNIGYCNPIFTCVTKRPMFAQAA